MYINSCTEQEFSNFLATFIVSVALSTSVVYPRRTFGNGKDENGIKMTL